MQKDKPISSSLHWRKEESLFACSSMLVFNQQKKGPQNDPLFREALYHMIDRKRLIAELGKDRISPAYGFRSDQTEVIEIFHLSATDFYWEDVLWVERQLKEYGIRITLENLNPNEPGGIPCDGRLFGVSPQAGEAGELEVYLQNNYFVPAYDEEMAAKVWETAKAVCREPDEQKRKTL